MNEIERVARALCRADDIGNTDELFEGHPLWAQYEDRATAAIAAMRGEPVAWMYSNPSDPLPPSIQAQRHDAMDFIAMRRRGWTETPLYAWPATDAENQRLRAEVEALREDCRKLLENEPVATCESCGTWLLDGDDYVTDPDGFAGCWASMTDVPSKTERQCYAYRVGKCDARQHLPDNAEAIARGE